MACSRPYYSLRMVLVLGGRSHHGAGAHLTVRWRGVEAHDMRAGARSARYALRIGDRFPWRNCPMVKCVRFKTSRSCQSALITRWRMASALFRGSGKPSLVYPGARLRSDDARTGVSSSW